MTSCSKREDKRRWTEWKQTVPRLQPASSWVLFLSCPFTVHTNAQSNYKVNVMFQNCHFFVITLSTWMERTWNSRWWVSTCETFVMLAVDFCMIFCFSLYTKNVRCGFRSAAILCFHVAACQTASKTVLSQKQNAKSADAKSGVSDYSELGLLSNL
jgi:hypothetical protein